MDNDLKNSQYVFDQSEETFKYPIELEFKMVNKVNNSQQLIGSWTDDKGVTFQEEFKNVPLPR